jgi:hypothetical protein
MNCTCTGVAVISVVVIVEFPLPQKVTRHASGDPRSTTSSKAQGL